MFIKENELPAFYAEIIKLGARVDEKEREIAFEISPSEPHEIEYWHVKHVKDDLYKIGWVHTTTCSSNPAQEYKTAPTRECAEKIEKAL
ncbi:MAG: hypothetical protein ABIG43_03120, partial [Chloroflexota bacterium]